MTRPWLSLDIETSGTLPEYALQPWRVKQRKAWITTIAITKRNSRGELSSKGLVYPTRDQIREILQMAIDKGLRIVGWNIAFDCSFLIAYGCKDLVDKLKWMDGMLAWKHLDMIPSFVGRHSYALKGEGVNSAIGAFLPHMIGYDEEVSYHSRTRAELEKLLAYNIKDTSATLIIAEEVFEKLDEVSERVTTLMIEAACIPMIANANLRGMHVDHEAVVQLDARLTAIAVDMEQRLEPHLRPFVKPKSTTMAIVRSPLQLSAVLYDQWKLPQIKKRSTDKEVMADLTVDDERVDWIFQWRQALNLRGKFCGGISKSCAYNEDGITRPRAIIFGTYTSRMTYGSKQGKKESSPQIGFALHQMKNDPEYRGLVIAPPPDKYAPEGYDIVEFDASGQEFRWMAIKSRDQTMLNLCQPGEDAHSFMGASITPGLEYEVLRGWHVSGDKQAKVPRKGGKVANLSLQYRTSGRTFRVRAKVDHQLVLTLDRANEIADIYIRRYPGVKDYWRDQIQLGKKLGYAETLSGRRVQVNGDWTGKMKWQLESTMINYPIQGTGGEQKYLAMATIKNVLHEYNAHFAWDLHDGIYWYVPKSKSMAFAMRVRSLLENLPYRRAWGFNPPIPLPWDAKVGPTWGQLKEI